MNSIYNKQANKDLRDFLDNVLAQSLNKSNDFELFCHNFIASTASKVIIRDCFTKKQEQQEKDKKRKHVLETISFELYKRSDRKDLIKSSEHLARIINDGNFKDTWVYFQTEKSHPTIDSLAVCFDKHSMPTNVQFFQMTISVEHSLKIVGRFVNYLSFFTSKYRIAKFQFFFVVSEKQFLEFHHTFDPTNKDDLDKKKLENMSNSSKNNDTFNKDFETEWIKAWNNWNDNQLESKLEIKCIRIDQDFIFPKCK